MLTRSSLILLALIITHALASSVNNQEQTVQHTLFRRQDQETPVTGTVPPITAPFSWSAISYSILLILSGLVMLFAGFRNRIIYCGTTTFYVAAFIVIIFLFNFEPVEGYELRQITYFVVPLCVGLTVAVFCTWKTFLGTLFGSGLGGFILAVCLSALGQESGVLENYAPGRALMMMFCYTFLTILASIGLRKPAIFSTSFAGAYFIVLGVDLWVQVGLALALPSTLEFSPMGQNPPIPPYTPDMWVYIELGIVVALFLVGALWQSKRYKHTLLDYRSVGFEKLF